MFAFGVKGGRMEGHGLMSFYIHWTTPRIVVLLFCFVILSVPVFPLFPHPNKWLSEPFCPSFFFPLGKRLLLVPPLLLPVCLLDRKSVV